MQFVAHNVPKVEFDSASATVARNVASHGVSSPLIAFECLSPGIRQA